MCYKQWNFHQSKLMTHTAICELLSIMSSTARSVPLARRYSITANACKWDKQQVMKKQSKQCIHQQSTPSYHYSQKNYILPYTHDANSHRRSPAVATTHSWSLHIHHCRQNRASSEQSNMFSQYPKFKEQVRWGKIELWHPLSFGGSGNVRQVGTMRPPRLVACGIKNLQLRRLSWTCHDTNRKIHHIDTP